MHLAYIPLTVKTNATAGLQPWRKKCPLLQPQAQHEIKRRERDYERLQVLTSPCPSITHSHTLIISTVCTQWLTTGFRGGPPPSHRGKQDKKRKWPCAVKQQSVTLTHHGCTQGRLRDLLVEKSREQKVALEAVGRFRDTARVRAKKSDEAMYQVCARMRRIDRIRAYICSQPCSTDL